MPTTAAPKSDRYFIATYAADVAKFTTAVVNHQAKLALHRMDPSAKFPMPPSKNAKHRAYGHAGQLERLLAKHGVIVPRAQSVPDMLATVAAAVDFIHNSVDAEALAAAEAAA